jgi:hypothetical protein
MEPRLSSEASLCEERPWTPEREAVLAALNGVLGDYLVATDNPLAIPMSLRRNGRALVLETQALAAAIPQGGRQAGRAGTRSVPE